ncbi:uncharacterized protein LOC126814219 [Patella vulgata]|uniref:uncharacterized protein LOC126814219 n=1 Tax=Patella vulgata TaxID=6465 RepID=UPI002180746F|nr:uncharacterized protein LOC126814219 [Patella vulgata]
MLPPGGLMEIVFSFDTTGSMSSCLNQVRGQIQDMVQRLQADIPSIRMAVFAHGDYCDKSTYVTKYIDFTTDVNKLCDFVKTTGSTGGGDTDECYELVLRQVREDLSWTPGSRRSLVLIGDAPPHEPSYPQNTLNIDWRDEADILGTMGVKIYATQCQSSSSAEKFYKTIAQKTGGHHLKLQEFSNIFDFLMAVAYREHGDELFQVYEKEVRSRCGTGLNKDLSDLFTTLRDGDIDSTTDDTTVTSTSLPFKKRKTSPGKVTSAKRVKLSDASKTATAPYKKPTSSKISRAIKTAKRTIKEVKVAYPRIRREMIAENHFYLNDKKWSPWQQVISHDAGLNKNGDWQQQGSYYRKKAIFQFDAETPSMYEVSVQAKRRSKRYIVYNKMAHRVSGKWERRLFAQSDIKKQVNKIADRGYNLYVRRLPLTSAALKRDTITALRRYDYSWRKIRNVRNNHRQVNISSTIISDDVL